MSEENSVSEVELPIQDVGAWKEAATHLLEHRTDRNEYTSDAKGIEAATEDRIRRRRETLNDAAEAPIIRHVGKDSKSPWKMADDVSFSKQLATSSQVFDANPTMSSQELFDATEQELHPPPREVSLDEASDLPKLGKRGIDPRDGLNLLDGAEALSNWRARQAQQQQEELVALQNEQAATEAWQAREQEQAQQTAAEQEQQAQQARRQEAEARALNAEHARIQGLQRIQMAEQQVRSEGARLFEYATNAFSDVASPEQLQQLRQSDPARYHHLMQVNKKAEEILTAQRQIDHAKRQASDEGQAQLRAQQAAQRAAILAQQDEAACSAIQREITDIPYQEIQKAAKEVLLKTGVSEAALAEHWNGKPVDLRNPNVQLILAKAGAYDRAQQRAAELRRSLADKQSRPPPVQRPGAGGQIVASRDAEGINELRSQLRGAKGTKAIALGTKLQQALRSRG